MRLTRWLKNGTIIAMTVTSTTFADRYTSLVAKRCDDRDIRAGHLAAILSSTK